MLETTFPQQVAWKTLNLLMERKSLIHPQGVAFYVWMRAGRVVVAFDPSAIDLGRVNEDFAHALSTRLHGRRVVRTNSRGLFLQVGEEIPAAPTALDTVPLDLTKQPSPWHMPIGLTAHGDLWISLVEGDSFLIGGSRGSGKSGLTQGMIQALLHGGKTDVWAWDGKRGAEFGRYIGDPNFTFVSDARQGLAALSTKLAERLDLLRASGYPNIQMHNSAGKEFIRPVALFVDEIAELDDSTKETLKGVVKLYRAAGLYPILATNDPLQSSVLVKTNLATRICFKVPGWMDSLTVLGTRGAEALSQVPGRGMMVLKGKLAAFQTYAVDYPQPSAETLRLLSEKMTESDVERIAPNAPVSIDALAESIREKWTADMSKRKVAELLGKPYGGAWARKTDMIIEYLTATTTTKGATAPVFALDGA